MGRSARLEGRKRRFHGPRPISGKPRCKGGSRTASSNKPDSTRIASDGIIKQWIVHCRDAPIMRHGKAENSHRQRHAPSNNRDIQQLTFKMGCWPCGMGPEPGPGWLAGMPPPPPPALPPGPNGIAPWAGGRPFSCKGPPKMLLAAAAAAPDPDEAPTLVPLPMAPNIWLDAFCALCGRARFESEARGPAP